jgi:hypothetical protein
MKPYSFVIRSHSQPIGNPPYSIWFPLESGAGKSYPSEEALRADLLFCGFPYEAIDQVFALLAIKGKVEQRHQGLSLTAFARLTTPEFIVEEQ